MTRGIIYLMSTAVAGLVKIGKTSTGNYHERMRFLEANGYANVTGLKREFAIEVEDYDAKEALIDDIFAKARVGTSELFALDVDLAKQLLAAFEGTQVYPSLARESKEEVFTRAVGRHRRHAEVRRIPNGTYRLDYKPRGSRQTIHVLMRVEDGELSIQAGQHVSTSTGKGLPAAVRELRDRYVDIHGLVLEDVRFDSPSAAGSFVTGGSCNGWEAWKGEDGRSIGTYR